MKTKENPSKVIIIPRPPQASGAEQTPKTTSAEPLAGSADAADAADAAAARTSVEAQEAPAQVEKK